MKKKKIKFIDDSTRKNNLKKKDLVVLDLA
jgi:hypothetical protein